MSPRFRSKEEEEYSEPIDVLGDEWIETEYEVEAPNPIVRIEGGRNPLAIWAEKFHGIPIEFWQELGVKAEGDRYISFNWPEGWKKMRDVTLRVDTRTNKGKLRPRFWWASPPTGAIKPLWPSPDEEKAHEEIWLAEGESDCAVLRFLDFDAYTFGAAGNMPSDIELRLLSRMGVQRANVVFDADTKGKQFSEKLITILSERNGIDAIRIDLDEILKQWRYVKDIRDLFNQLPKEDVRAILSGAKAAILEDREEDISAAKLAEMAQMPEWVWDGLIAKGALNLVYGPAKIGKTTLTYHIIKACQEGGKLLGRDIKQQRVLYYSEMPASFDKQSMMTIIGEAPQNLWIRVSSNRVFDGVTWPGIVMQIERDVKKYNIDYVVVDTVIEWFKFQSEEMYDAAVVGEKLRLLRRLTAKNVTVQINHHPPKAGGSPFGSIAFQGYVDCLVDMERDDQGTTLSAKGRLRSDFSSVKYAYADDEGTSLAVIAVDDKGDRSIDTTTRTTVKNRILALLPYQPGSMTLEELRSKDELLNSLGKQLPTRIKELVKSGMLGEIDASPKRFYRALGFSVEVQKEES